MTLQVYTKNKHEVHTYDFGRYGCHFKGMYGRSNGKQKILHIYILLYSNYCISYNIREG